MASTTKTTNLELSQFVGTDKPAWLTDYNGDMQKIDNGYKKLEDANTATQADLDATKQDLSGSKTDIDDVKASVQSLEAQDIAIGNRLTVVEGNYDTMHHEVAINQQSIDDIETDLGVDEALTTTATTVHGAINEILDEQPVNNKWNDFSIYLSPSGSDNNDGKTEATPMKTITGAIDKYSNKAQNIYLYCADGTYDINYRIRLRMPRLIFNSISNNANNVIININTDQLTSNILEFGSVTVNIKTNVTIDASKIRFLSTTILNVNAELHFENVNIAIEGAINMAGNISFKRSTVAYIGKDCAVNVVSGRVYIYHSIGFIYHDTIPVTVANAGVVYHVSANTPTVNSPAIAIQYN